MRFNELIRARKVQPNLEQLERVRTIAIEQRKHFCMDDATPCRQPLHVSAAEARRRPERIRVIDVPAPDDGDGFEAPMGMLRKAGDDIAVIHAPAVAALEVLTDIAARQRRDRTEAIVALREMVDVVDGAPPLSDS